MRKVMIWVSVGSIAVISILGYYSQRLEIAELRGGLARMRAQHRDAQNDGAPLFGAVRYIQPDLKRAPLVLPRGASEEQPSDAASEPAVDVVGISAARWEQEARANQVAVEDAFAAETTDPAWASGAAIDIREHLGVVSAALSSTLGGIDCRSSICRVEMTARDPDALKQTVNRGFGVGQKSVWTGPMMANYQLENNGGMPLVVLYLGREGTSLFRPAQ